MKSRHVYTHKIDACLAEGWEVDGSTVWAYGKSFPIADPLAIHLKAYRTHESHETRYQAMYNAFKTLWPEQVKTYNYWMERIFREHTNHDTEVFTIAGGSGIGKTQACAYMTLIFVLALPTKRTAIVTSTTIASLRARIYGYILRAVEESAIPLPLNIVSGPPPCITPAKNDRINGIYGIAAKQGSDREAIKDLIGRHPKNALLLVLDEAPDMPIAIMDAFPNLKQGLADRFQACGIGNSASTADLHGILSTPKNGWDSIDPYKDYRWETTQEKGVCLYFNPYDSPAIHETDPKKKSLLKKFLVSEERLIDAERNQGKDSDEFWRFTMGFWRSRSTEKTIVSESFLKNYDPTQPAEFSGKHPIIYCAGLDPAFSIGGDKCILRLAVLGHHVNGRMVMDFRGRSLLFEIKLMANTGDSAELQIAKQVIDICKRFSVPLNTLCVDASGQGRGLADIIQLVSGGSLTPVKVYSTNVGRHTKTFDIHITSAHDMWFKGREFISNHQLHGLDENAYHQLHTRQIVDKGGKKILEPKPEYKKRMAAISSSLARSPDEADAAMLCIQSAVLLHGFHPGQMKEILVFKDEDSRKYHMTVEAYRARMRMDEKKRQDIRPRFSSGLDSLVRRKTRI